MGPMVSLRLFGSSVNFVCPDEGFPNRALIGADIEWLRASS
jgi:hypothetical protein